MRAEFVVNTRDQLEEAISFLSRFKLQKPVRLVVEHFVAGRTPAQNARHRAIVGQAARELGCSPDRLHEDLLCECFGFTEYKLAGGRIERTPKRRSSDLDIKEMSDFMNFSEAYLADLGMTFV